jgi:hypothetical protein
LAIVKLFLNVLARLEREEAFFQGRLFILGLKVICVRDDAEYKLARKVSDEDFDSINIAKIAPFECWNYRISPQ